MNTKVFAVIGRGYGDEGKGLATDYLAGLFQHEKCIVVRHNGGAQSGHTVEKKSGERFVFHELSSGSLNGADTFWARTFYPDLYKLKEETESFRESFGFIPKIFADSKANITLPFDVMINMAIENKRGSSRHGSCGMGINEADLRTKAGFGITISYVKDLDSFDLINKIQIIREEYICRRLSELGLTGDEIPAEINDDEITAGFAESIKDNLKYVQVTDDAPSFIKSYDDVVFESGQGLLLDADNAENTPYVTASKTGLTNPLMLTKEWGLEINKTIYVTRSYLTRHGAGPLRNECDMVSLGIAEQDMTNVSNEWQGKLRHGMFDNLPDLLAPVINDMHNSPQSAAALLITHLNETGNMIMTTEGELILSELYEECLKCGINEILVSRSKYSSDIEKYIPDDV